MIKRNFRFCLLLALSLCFALRGEFVFPQDSPEEIGTKIGTKISEEVFAIKKEYQQLRQEKGVIDSAFNQYKQNEILFLKKLNDKELEYYANYYESLLNKNWPKTMLYHRKLKKELNSKLLNIFFNLNEDLMLLVKMNLSYKEKKAYLDNRKQNILDFTRLAFDDDTFYFMIHKELTE
jgi:hypothetical protein